MMACIPMVELAFAVGLTLADTKRMCDDGRLRCIRIGEKVLIDQEEIKINGMYHKLASRDRTLVGRTLGHDSFC